METWMLIAIFVIGLLALAGVSSKIVFGGFSISSRPKNLMAIARKVQEICHVSARKCESYRCNILRFQMTHAEGVLDDLMELTQAPASFRSIAHSHFKASFLSNGLVDMTPVDFSRYVGDKIDGFRRLFLDNIPESGKEYARSPDFSDKIGECFNHGRSCAERWLAEIERTQKDCDDRVKELLDA